ncbi:MAG: hypothetical protein GWN01_11820 [Nitrosopumilaceae archaeon]|nr:hypothetical protein [Nitrosopumilaceae archaeon]NIU01563.1 hypothetical protein [Nitrosopumilaceae archaeon]NIU88544.1 hypothetical protein [Nitrosopumilaceae archaeon]NIV66249.1 hypothetical protein [Nitrosopumilaceae archaeon]NIX62165.1 hypothetical protein [Nitrosopumilaceae archaeon]
MSLDFDDNKDFCRGILELDETIRFVGKVDSGKVVSFVRRASPLLDDELSNMAHYQASHKANMEEMFDGQLGQTDWMITSKEQVKLITLFLDDGLLILSTEPDCNHDQLINKIKKLNIKI